ncbi:uncharacterized protein BO80DRAFT_228842 [Aspergillus ibericus CBS 121593]|uniref:Uncharacterized protein n=1 Tax=Aspergillus ibericus CBS 121593 TaxID=1448316 RepID=A0A395GLK4_9EURO|nr:hypothetical protein BO80DRAFT_228842 [Aspergillus ibericus CBS 121593]RAK96390.1 hypothetical protein BO80DRAFT_228842 [Aspergillus ibericus CBS 121593]
MSGSSRLDGRQHVQSSQLQTESRDAAATQPDKRPGHNSNYDTLDPKSSRAGVSPPDTESSAAVNRTPEPPPAQAPPFDRQSHSPISTGLAPVSQAHLDISNTQTTSSQTQRSPGAMDINRSTGQQVMPDASTSNNQQNHPSGIIPGSLSHNPVAPKTAGVAKPLTETARNSGVHRRRSRSIGSLSRESRIAALSVHLRTRLSYAAAKIEKSRRQGVQSHLSPSTESLAKIGLLGELEAQRILENSSPDGTTMSAPDPPASFNLHTPTGSRLSPVAQSVDASPPPLHLDPPRSQASSRPARPKLAPPADIIASGGSSRRRRPNPNEPITSLHRRHRSQQEFGASRPATHSEIVLVPGTPPLRPSRTAPYNAGSHNHARSSAMEQDAIETLLFMSSPGHSGYHSSSQHSQPHQHVFRSSDSRGSDGRVPPSQDSHASSSHGWTPRSHGQDLGLEAQAGDAIDRMLDQMDSDSDDDIKFASSHSSRQADSSQGSQVSQGSQGSLKPNTKYG